MNVDALYTASETLMDWVRRYGDLEMLIIALIDRTSPALSWGRLGWRYNHVTSECRTAAICRVWRPGGKDRT